MNALKRFCRTDHAQYDLLRCRARLGSNTMYGFNRDMAFFHLDMVRHYRTHRGAGWRNLWIHHMLQSRKYSTKALSHKGE